MIKPLINTKFTTVGICEYEAARNEYTGITAKRVLLILGSEFMGL